MKIHFVGIRGVSMSRLADICRRRGDTVTGSDLAAGGHRAENVHGADLVVYTGAAAADNPELAEARRLHIPTIERARMLADIAASYPLSIAISGCHGKTTATALTGCALAVRSPEVHVGGGCDFPPGAGVFVTEACEYRRSFLALRPDIAVVLNVGLDHTDCYRDIDEIFDAYRTFALSAGTRIVNGDDAYCRAIPGAVTFGTGENCDYRAVNVTSGRELSFDLLRGGRRILSARLPLVGKHNAYNALAAFAAADAAGAKPAEALIGMQTFTGVKRRFERVGEAAGAAVYTDYAHHPTEIEAALTAARALCRGRIIAVFEPHTYTRTAAFAAQFAEALCAADSIVLAPVYAARETPIAGVCAQSIWLELRRRHRPAAVFDTYCEINRYVTDIVRQGDLVLYLGAGSIDKAARDICGGG